MPYAYTNGIVTYYEDVGEGPVVVLVHGHSVDLRMWREQVPALVTAGFRVVRYDVRGHGRSLIAPDGYTWESYAADLRDLLDRLNVERPVSEGLPVPAAHVVGLSMGGGIALQFALDYPPRVLSLSLVDSTLPGYTYSEELSGRIQELVRAVRAEGIQPAFERLWLTHPMFDGVRRRPQQWALLREMVAGFQAPEYREDPSPPEYEQPAVADRLGDITVPALVIAGEHDVADFRLIAQILASNLRHARLTEMPGCYHVPPMEDPERFNETLVRFLQGTSGRGVAGV